MDGWMDGWMDAVWCWHVLVSCHVGLFSDALRPSCPPVMPVVLFFFSFFIGGEW